MLGFASHAPGGIGVFDAAMLVALWQYDKEDLLAGLLLFRLLYYLVPFVVCVDDFGHARNCAQYARRANRSATGGSDRQRAVTQRNKG